LARGHTGRLRNSQLTPAPAEGEVQALAKLLGSRPDKISSIKLPGPGGLGESPLTRLGLPELEGFETPTHLDVAWNGERKHPAARYDSQAGSLIVVSHETGPQIFFVAEALAATTTVVRAVLNVMSWVRARREENGAPPGIVRAAPIQFWFYESGTLRHRKIFPAEPE